MIYNIVNKGGHDHSLRIFIESGSELKYLFGQAGNDENYQYNWLFMGEKACDLEAGKKLEDYFFEKTIDTVYRKMSGRYEIVKLNAVPGQYFPRVYRPTVKRQSSFSNLYYVNKERLIDNGALFDFIPHDLRTVIAGVQQLNIILENLESIFKYIYPSTENFNSYGHELRDLLILSCTEVEAQLKGIMRENEIKPSGKYFTMFDYFKLCDVLKLRDYGIELSFYPELGIIYPFKDWIDRKVNPYWYQHYNEVKHDRELEFKKANLHSVIYATCAVCLLQVAQYGYNIPHWNDLIGSFFKLGDSPDWEIKDCYLPPLHPNVNWFPRTIK